VLQPPTWGSTHFSRLLRHAWATVGLFFSPVTTRNMRRNALTLLFHAFEKRDGMIILKRFLYIGVELQVLNWTVMTLESGLMVGSRVHGVASRSCCQRASWLGS